MRETLHGAVNPTSRPSNVFSQEQAVYAARCLILNNDLHYVDALALLQKRCPDAVLGCKDTLSKHLCHGHGFRQSDFVRVPVQRNLPHVIKQRMDAAHWRLDNHDRGQVAIFIDETGFHLGSNASKGLSLLHVHPQASIRSLRSTNMTLICACGKARTLYLVILVGPAPGAIFASFLDSPWSRISSAATYCIRADCGLSL